MAALNLLHVQQFCGFKKTTTANGSKGKHYMSKFWFSWSVVFSFFLPLFIQPKSSSSHLKRSCHQHRPSDDRLHYFDKSTNETQSKKSDFRQKLSSIIILLSAASCGNKSVAVRWCRRRKTNCGLSSVACTAINYSYHTGGKKIWE